MLRTRHDGERRRPPDDEEHPNEASCTCLHHGHGEHFFSGVNDTDGLA